MIVKVSEIPEEGLDLEYGVGPELFGEGPSAAAGAGVRTEHGKGAVKPEVTGHGVRGGKKHAGRTKGESDIMPAHQPGETVYPGLRLYEDAHARFHIENKGSVILVDGELDAVVGLECSRCTRRFELPVHESFRVDLATPDSFGDEADVELHADDMDVGVYDGEKIDLNIILREQLLLQIPIKPLCSEDCKGICQHCGKDLNKGGCDCSEPTGHVGLTGLKELLDKMKEGEHEDGESN